MKKILLTSLALLLCLSAAVYAAPKDKGGDSGSHSSASNDSNSGSSSNDHGSASSSNDDDAASSSEDTDSDSSSKNSGSDSSSKGAVSESSKGSGKEDGIKGSQASEDRLVEESKVENIQGKQSSQAELKAYADKIRKELSGYDQKEKQNILTSLVDTYEQAGDVEQAIDVQQEVIQTDLYNVDAYKKIGKLYEKAGQKGVKAFVNGIQPPFDVPPVIKDGRTLIPIRAISQSLKADVKWDPATKTVTITKEGVEIQLILNENKALINGQEVTLEAPAGVINSRTVVPARFISEAFGALVKYEPETQSVIIIDEPAGDTDSNEATGEEQVNEPKAEELAAVEPVEGEKAVEESAAVEPTVQEPPAVEPPVVDEAKLDETTLQEATPEEATIDETALGEVTVDEALIDASVLQDLTDETANPQ